MFPPSSSTTHLDLDALSGICGSISIACWVVVFSPQILENFRRQSAEGLSVVFIIVWLAGDVFNILGGVLQGILPTMLILAVYYTLADVVLLGQVWWYRGFTLKDEVVKPANGNALNHENGDAERRPLLRDHDGTVLSNENGNGHVNGALESRPRNGSFSTLRRHLSIDGAHLSPATPLLNAPKPTDPPAIANNKPQSVIQAVVFNTFAVLLVCAAGVFGWWVSSRSTSHKHGKHGEDDLRGELPQFDVLGQVFGYFCAVLYLGSRVPQLLLNYRRKSTEGVSLLFFLFACIGNLTYDMSIFAFNPAPYCENGPKHCLPGERAMVYSRYIAVNASWIAGSLGTLLLDLAIFVQFFLYRTEDLGNE